MTTEANRLSYEAGVWEQRRSLVVWSQHHTAAAAAAAARKYARQLRREGAATGGAKSWSGGWRRVDGATTWISA